MRKCSSPNSSIIAVPEAGDGVAAVVAGQGLAQGRLGRGAWLGATQAFGQHRLHRAQVLAGVEGTGRRQPQARKVLQVDLCQADAEVPAGFA